MTKRSFQTITIGLALVLLAMGFILPAKTTYALSYSYDTFPDGKLGLPRPDIGVRLDLSEALDPKSYIMYLNGSEVPVQYDSGEDSFIYRPVEDLPAGDYEVQLVIRYPGYEAGMLSWKFAILPGAANLIEPSTKEQREGLQAINDYRLLHGLLPVTLNDKLNAAAKKHAQYLYINEIDPIHTSVSLHDEDPSKPGYIGKTLSERMDYVGYDRSASEDAAYNDDPLIEAIDSLFDAPYHRIPFLNPNLSEIGIYRSDIYHVVEFGFNEALTPKLVVSPAEGDSYVPVAFDGNESPDPIRIHRGGNYPVGYPIMGLVNGAGIQKVSIVQAELKDEKGKSLELLINEPSGDDHLNTEVILMPAKPLTPDTKYQAKLKINALKKDGTDQIFEKEWSFRTEPSAGMGAKKLHNDVQSYLLQKNKFGLNQSHTVKFGLDDSFYTLDQVSSQMRRAPYIVSGTSFLYIRDLAAALGASVEWDDARKAAIYTKKDKIITFFTNRNAYAVGGVEVPTESPARLIDDNTMIPVRLLSETLGAKVDYIESTRTVVITY